MFVFGGKERLLSPSKCFLSFQLQCSAPQFRNRANSSQKLKCLMNVIPMETSEEVMVIKGNWWCIESDTKFSSPCFSIYVCFFYIHQGFSPAFACAHKKFKRYLAYYVHKQNLVFIPVYLYQITSQIFITYSRTSVLG